MQRFSNGHADDTTDDTTVNKELEPRGQFEELIPFFLNLVFFDGIECSTETYMLLNRLILRFDIIPKHAISLAIFNVYPVYIQSNLSLDRMHLKTTCVKRPPFHCNSPVLGGHLS